MLPVISHDQCQCGARVCTSLSLGAVGQGDPEADDAEEEEWSDEEEWDEDEEWITTEDIAGSDGEEDED